MENAEDSGCGLKVRLVKDIDKILSMFDSAPSLLHGVIYEWLL